MHGVVARSSLFTDCSEKSWKMFLFPSNLFEYEYKTEYNVAETCVIESTFSASGVMHVMAYS